MATQLGLYNEALRLAGERRLASLAEAREPRRLLDDIWNDGAVDACLEQGLWNFAMRAVEVTAAVTVPAFGFTYTFDKPLDWIRTAGLSASETFNPPMLDYMEEAGLWFTNAAPIYVRYVSNATTYGKDYDLWPPGFTKFVAAYLAYEVNLSLTQDEKKQDRLFKLMLLRRSEARSRDAMNEATAFPPQGSWSQARLGRSRRDRGNRGQLTG